VLLVGKLFQNGAGLLRRALRHRSRVGRAELSADLLCPDADSVPVAHVYVLVLVDTAEDADRERLKLGHLGERVLELLTRSVERNLLTPAWPHPEDSHRLRCELFAAPFEQPARVSVPATAVERTANHDGVVAAAILDLPGWLNLDLEPSLAERRPDCFRSGGRRVDCASVRE